MKIIKISQQKFKKEYQTIYLEGGDHFRLHEELVLRNKLSEGSDLDPNRLSQLRNEEEKKEAVEVSYLYLRIRPRSEKELSDRLRNKGFSSETTKAVIEDLKEKRLVDDAQFAQDFAETRFKNKSLGVRKVESDLYQKGIDKEVVRHAIQNIIQSSQALNEEERAFQALERRAKQIHLPDSRTFYRRLYSFLARRGFSYDTIEQALSRFKREGGFRDPNTREDRPDFSL